MGIKIKEYRDERKNYERFRFKKSSRGGGNGVNPSGSGHSEGDNYSIPEESQNLVGFTNNAMFRAEALNMTNVAYKHSRHTEEQHLQNPNSSSQRGGEFVDGRRVTSLDSFVFPRPLWERARVRGVNKNKRLITDWIVSHTLTMTKNFISNAILRVAQEDEMNFSRFTFHFSQKSMNSERCRLMRVEVRKTSGKVAFTLTEVLITLAIIGVVATLTLPTVINKCQSYILKQQFRKAYSTFYNAIKLVQVQNGAPIACYYWEKNPYVAGGNPAVCDGWDNKYDTCNHWTLKDGTSIPSDYNGHFSECQKFSEDLMKTLKVVKFCEKEALKNGCLTENYRGVDKVKKESEPDKNFDTFGSFSDYLIKNSYPVFITTDGALYIRYSSMSEKPIFALDVNGHKGPNKWGYDIFVLRVAGTQSDGATTIQDQSYVVEKGGKRMEQMMKEF